MVSLAAISLPCCSAPRDGRKEAFRAHKRMQSDGAINMRLTLIAPSRKMWRAGTGRVQAMDFAMENTLDTLAQNCDVSMAIMLELKQ